MKASQTQGTTFFTPEGFKVYTPNTTYDLNKVLYISYTTETVAYGCDTTAICLNQGLLFIILMGDHRKDLLDSYQEGGLEKMLIYCNKNQKQIHKKSEVKFFGYYAGMFNESEKD
jgi:hypothetical protein